MTTEDYGHKSVEVSSDDQKTVTRRWVFLALGAAFNGVVGLALATPIIRYLLSPARKDSSYTSWVSLGQVNSFPVGQTRLASFVNPYRRPTDGQTDDIPCWVRRNGTKDFTVFAINCAHLGCPVRWFPQSQLFMCPCHGGVYYADGSRAAGPPERGLFTYDYKIVNGSLRIDAGQMPTLSNSPSAQLVTIGGCKGDSPCAG